MFHNGSYAMCDVALHSIAISMGYSRLHDVGARACDYANPSVGLAQASIKGRGCLADLSVRPRATRGVNWAAAEDAGIPRTRLTSKAPGPDFSFSPRYFGD